DTSTDATLSRVTAPAPAVESEPRNARGFGYDGSLVRERGRKRRVARRRTRPLVAHPLRDAAPARFRLRRRGPLRRATARPADRRARAAAGGRVRRWRSREARLELAGVRNPAGALLGRPLRLRAAGGRMDRLRLVVPRRRRLRQRDRD